jgi:predicted deacylase
MPRVLRVTPQIIFVLAAVAFALPARAQQNSFSVGSANAAPGQKATGYLDIPAGGDAGTRIPVVVIRGAHPGPVLAIVSGSHGTEYASIIAVEHLITYLDPANVSGTVILVPLVNSASFLQKVPHVNPVDNKSMNRFYPGKMDGTQTDRVSYIITKQIVERCDYLIDLHGGDLDENLRPYSYWTISGNDKVDRTSKEMALAFGLDHIIIQTDFPRDPAASRYLSNTALTRGKPAAIAEAGYSGTVEPADVHALAWGCENIMRYLKMLPGNAPLVQNPVWIEKVETVTSDQEGIFYPLVNRGNYVAAGTEIGYVTDYFGNTIRELRSPVAGVVLYVCAVPTMNKGGTAANIGVVAAKAP